MEKILIVGAGVAGLTAGYHLSQKGFEVQVVEKEARVGGLARSFQYGDFILGMTSRVARDLLHRRRRSGNSFEDYISNAERGGIHPLYHRNDFWT